MAELKSYYERINRLLNERDGINGDIADIYQEVKASGYVPKILRKVITRHRADPSKLAEEDALLETYEAALDSKTRQALKMAREGKSAREIEDATGIDHSTVARSVPATGKRGRKPKLSQPATNTKVDVITPPEVATLPPHDPETGEIKTDESASAVVASLADSPVGTGASNIETASEPPPSPVSELGVGAGTMTVPELAAATLALPPKQAAAVVAVLDALADERERAEINKEVDHGVVTSEPEVAGAAPPATESRSPDFSGSAEQPSSNAADVPTREDGRAGEREPDDWDSIVAEQQRLNEARARVLARKQAQA